jgi:hypothetical protein
MKRVILLVFGIIGFSGCAIGRETAPTAADMRHDGRVVVLVTMENVQLRSKIEDDLIEALSSYQAGPVASLSLLRAPDPLTLDRDVYDILAKNADRFSFVKEGGTDQERSQSEKGAAPFGNITASPADRFKIEVFDLRKNEATWKVKGWLRSKETETGPLARYVADPFQ